MVDSRPDHRIRRRALTFGVVAVAVALGLAQSPALAAQQASRPVTRPEARPVTRHSSTTNVGTPVQRKSRASDVRPGCAAPARAGYARCFSLIRTDITPKAARPDLTPDGYGPADLRSAYNLPGGASGRGQIVGIVDAFDDPTAEADLAVYRSQYGLPPCTTDNGCFRKVNQDGEAAPLPDVDAGWATEISLDLDMVSAACPNCSIVLVETDDNSLDNLGSGVGTAVALGAKYVSNSYGATEDPSETDADAYYDHPGVVVTASTGDNGYGASYPATAPGVTAVGGTSLTKDSSARGWTESAWDGAGSGCSSFEPKPSFQKDAGCDMRAVADVSADADPQTGVAIYDSTPYEGVGWQVYGGTSASSPFIASVYALAGTPAPDSDPASYPYTHPDQLNDVTSGSNGSCDVDYLCTSGPGYDGPTGLGTPNGATAFSSGPHGLITGTVTDSATSKPLAGAKVAAGTVTAISGTDGTYTLSVPVGTYSVSASDYGYATSTVAAVAVADGASVDEDFTLTPVPTVTLSGNVHDASGHGWPLYAKITIDGVPGAPIYTDPFTGHYSVDLPENHTYSMSVQSVYPGYNSPAIKAKLTDTDHIRNIPVKVDVSACDAPGYLPKYTGGIEHFDADTIPSDWTVLDNNGSGGVWVANDPGERGNLTGGTGNFAIIDSDELGLTDGQDTSLVSPVTDLSAVASPEVGLASDYRAFLDSSEADIDYTIDGGKTWTNVWKATTDDQQGPLELALPKAAHQKAVQVRFHYTGDFSYYWEVDDVFIGSKTCSPTAGGLVAGFTRDGNTNSAITGVQVVSDSVPADGGVSAATPDDAAIADGFYWLYSTVTGTHSFTASKSHYTSSTRSVGVQANYVTRQDFVLGAGQLRVAPGSVTGQAVLGGSASTSLTLTNTGTAAVHVDVAEADGGTVIAGRRVVRHYRSMRGAPVRHVRGHFSPLRSHAASRPASRDGVPAAAPWTSIADLPVGLTSNAAAYGDGTLYSVGGYDGTNDVASLYAYDPSSTSWSTRADMPQTREAPAVAFVGGKLYVIGGWGPDGSPLTDTEVYDPDADSWTSVAAEPTPYAASGVAVLGNDIYVIGGCTAASCGTSDVQVYDTTDGSWSAGPDYPEATAWQGCGAISGVVYCAGGTTDAASSTATYAFDGSAWSPRADLPADDWGGASAAANGQLLVSGGVIDDSSTVTNEGWSYDPVADAWTALPNSNDATYRLGGACGFYKVGGGVDQFSPPSAGVEVLPGYNSCDTAQDVSWLTETPTSVDLAPGASTTVAVTMDSAGLAQPGTYTASLTLATDTPYRVAPVAVTFVVTPPKTWGRVGGVIMGKPCAGAAAPIAGATVEIDTWTGTHTLTTDKNGTYALWLDKRNNPLTMIVAKDGWAPQTTTVQVTPGTPLVRDFTLKPSRAC